jgi:hypothetical protein
MKAGVSYQGATPAFGFGNGIPRSRRSRIAAADIEKYAMDDLRDSKPELDIDAAAAADAIYVRIVAK